MAVSKQSSPSLAGGSTLRSAMTTFGEGFFELSGAGFSIETIPGSVFIGREYGFAAG